MGITIVCLKQSGNIPKSSEWLNKIARIGAIIAINFLSISFETLVTLLVLPIGNLRLALIALVFVMRLKLNCNC